jgi:hypothetical protein
MQPSPLQNHLIWGKMGGLAKRKVPKSDRTVINGNSYKNNSEGRLQGHPPEEAQ